MSETTEDLEHSATWMRGLVLLSETPGYRPAAMSYVTPSEYRQRAEDLLARYATALATETAKREQAEAHIERLRVLLDSALAEIP